MVMYMKILSIDQARNGAWAVFEYNTKTLEAYGTFSYDAKNYTYAKAILEIEKLIQSVIKEHKVKAVFIEDIQLRVNVQSFKKLAQLQGVLVNLCEKNEYLYELIAPSQWQSYCNARPRKAKERDAQITALRDDTKAESKVLSLQFANDKYGINTDNDNLSDVICISHYVINNFLIKKDKSGKLTIEKVKIDKHKQDN